MRESKSGLRRAEKIAGVIAVIAALVVLNGAWVNQHNWQNVSWRVAVAGVLVVLAMVVETGGFGLLPSHAPSANYAVPDFMLAGDAAPADARAGDASRADADAVGAGERRSL